MSINGENAHQSKALEAPNKRPKDLQAMPASNCTLELHSVLAFFLWSGPAADAVPFPLLPFFGTEFMTKKGTCLHIDHFSGPCSGADGKTYGNACKARCRGVEIKEYGECSCYCTEEYMPVW
eukprot:1148417-Pelagomonas_calceolata.AAC.3